jgi:hypothetical protein
MTTPAATAAMRERMAWRKWLVRSLVFSFLGLAVLAAVLYEAWTNPTAIRREVLAKLTHECVGATVSLDSARLRLLGGIAVRDLRLARRDDLGRGDFLYVPSAVIYHDKEHLLEGTLAFHKIELDRPRLRIIRERDGRINLGGVLAPPDPRLRVPTIIIRRGTLVLEDYASSANGVVLEIKDVNLTVVNDPLSTLLIDGSGQTDAMGSVRIQARFHRPSSAASAVVELPNVPVGPLVVQRLANFCPAGARHLRELSGDARIQAVLTYRPGAGEPLSYDVHAELKNGQWQHERLPAVLRQLHVSLRCLNGRIPHAQLQARADDALVKVEVRNAVWPGHPPQCLEEVVSNIDARIEHFPIASKTFDPLPPACQRLRELYRPAGPVTLTYRFQRDDAGHWDKRWRIQPEGMTACFKEFPYPLDAVTGNIDVHFASEAEDEILVDLAGRGSDRPLRVRGSIHGEKRSAVDLVIEANDVPVDQKLLIALPKNSLNVARTFLPIRSRELGLLEQPLGLVQPAGLADIKVFVRRNHGEEHFTNRYLIGFHDTSIRYDLFPYPLEKVTGVLDIQPDHWECRDFHGSHKGGEISVNACSFRVDAGEAHAVQAVRADLPSTDNSAPENRRPQRECVQVAIRGKNILLDPEFEQALSPPEVPGRAALRNAWSMLTLRGRLNFESIVVDRPDEPQDIDVAVDLKGCSMKPEFFRYAMSDLSAGVRYVHGQVEVKNASARHGACRLGLEKAIIVLKPGGGFGAWLTGIRGDDLLIDEEFLRALHPALRRGLEPLQIRNPLHVETSLTLDAPAVPGEPMKIWWDGGARLRKQILQTGVEIKDVDGVIWCHGHHNGRQFEGVSGHALLERATILDQPFTQLQGRIEVAPETPDILSLYDLKANVFGGFVGGEARFTFSAPIHYEVKLDALNVQLEQFGRHNQLGADAQLQGPARAALHLIGDGTDLSGLKGNGRIEVAHGKMYRLPLLLDLLKAFGLRMPDRTAFEQARMIFGIEGPQMRIHALDLFGNAISLRGQGTLNLDGSNVHLDFSADWGRVPQMLPPGLSDGLQGVSDLLFKIKVRGKLSSPHFDKELVPGVVEPIKKVFGRS